MTAVAGGGGAQSISPRILFGVGGSIAAYKACEIVRFLRGRTAEVRVAMTPAAEIFVGAATFEALSGSPVVRSATENPLSSTGSRISHTDLAAWADLFLVAPATADLLAKFAHGLGDDAVSLLYLAFPADRPRLLAPAMNVEMWASPATQRAVRFLTDPAVGGAAGRVARGAHFIGPESGDLACGAVGPGRMSEPENVAAAALALLPPRDLAGRTVLILSGPTRERLDSVRYLTNPSSGRMGRALAEAARARGAEVVVVTGPADILPPHGIRTVAVESAAEMRAAGLAEVDRADLVIGAAAVSDIRFAGGPREEKIPRNSLGDSLAVEKTADVLGGLSVRRKTEQVFVGFAAEEDLSGEKAEEERRARGLDLVLANRIPDAFGSSRAEAVILSEAGREDLGVRPKEEIASILVERAAGLLVRSAAASRA